MPNNVEDYVHRIGRTGRAGRSGTSYSFFTLENARMARDLIKILEDAKQEVPKELYDMSRVSKPSGGSHFGNSHSRGGGRPPMPFRGGHHGPGGGGGHLNGGHQGPGGSTFHHNAIRHPNDSSRFNGMK